MVEIRFLEGGGPVQAGPGLQNNTNSTTGEHLPAPTFEAIITFIVVSSIISSLIEGFFPRKITRLVPQPVILMLLYIIFGAIVGEAFSVDIHAETILTVFLPALLHNEALKIKTQPFYRALPGLIWLIGPALFTGAAIVAIYPYYFFPPEDRFSWYLSMAFGGMLATTDPIAVMMFLAEVMAPHKLRAMVSGESLLNDATSIICVTICLELNLGEQPTAGEVIFFIVNQLLFSILFGTAIGIVTFLILRQIKILDAHTLFALSISMPYLSFIVAQFFFHSSGVFSLIPVGLFFNHFLSGVASEASVHSIQEFWETLSFLTTSWLYSLTGLLVGIELGSSSVQRLDWAVLLGLYFWILLARFIIVYFSLPVFKCLGSNFSIQEATLLVWGGLRGAVGLLLALTIKTSPGITLRQGNLVLFMMAGIVVLIELQGVTFPFLLKKLKVLKFVNPHVLDTLRTKMAHRAFFALRRAGIQPGTAKDALRVTKEEPKEHVSVRFTTQRMRDIMERDKDMEPHHITGQYVSITVLNDKRKRLLQAQISFYNNLLSRELISRTAWLLLTQSIKAQLDHDTKGPAANQWEHLIQYAPRTCCSFFGKNAETKELLHALFSHDLKSYLTLKREERQKHLSQQKIESQANNNVDPLLASAGADDKKQQQGDVEDSLEKGLIKQESQAAATESAAKPPSLVDPKPSLSVRGRSSRRNNEPTFRNCWNCCARWFQAEVDDVEYGDIVDSKRRDFGIDCEEALNFTYISWAFLIAQQHSSDLIEEMFRLDDQFIAFECEQLALRAEIARSCAQPALFLDIIMEFLPSVCVTVKSAQAVAEVKSQIYGYIDELFETGLVDSHHAKRLLKDAGKIQARVEKLRFPLESPYSVGVEGVEVLKCPNFHPFYQSDLSQKLSLEDFEMIESVHHLKEDRHMTGKKFWSKRKRSKSKGDKTPSLQTPPPSSTSLDYLSNQLTFSDAPIDNESFQVGKGNEDDVRLPPIRKKNPSRRTRKSSSKDSSMEKGQGSEQEANSSDDEGRTPGLNFGYNPSDDEGRVAQHKFGYNNDGDTNSEENSPKAYKKTSKLNDEGSEVGGGSSDSPQNKVSSFSFGYNPVGVNDPNTPDSSPSSQKRVSPGFESKPSEAWTGAVKFIPGTGSWNPQEVVRTPTDSRENKFETTKKAENEDLPPRPPSIAPILLRQVSAGSLTIGTGENDAVEPMDSSEYYKMISSRTPRPSNFDN